MSAWNGGEVGWSWPCVFVCAPFGRASEVRAVHAQLLRARFRPTSRWAEFGGPETLADEVICLRALAQNLSDMLTSNAVLALGFDGEGCEMFVEIGRALAIGKRVFWTGRHGLSWWGSDVVRCDNIEHAIRELEWIR